MSKVDVLPAKQSDVAIHHVLDHGYVRLVDVMGDDLTVVNAARVSFDKESSWVINYDSLEEYLFDDAPKTPQLEPKDKKLLRYLAEHGHTSPFRHAVLSFEIYAPMMVMRQWGKYRVGSVFSFEDSTDSIDTWNEASRRYVTEEPEFYIPEVWRSAPENKKQGSGAVIDAETCLALESSLYQLSKKALNGYEYALSLGACAEQARLFLPAYAMYIRARWTVSLQGVIHFLQQRLGEDSQWETQQFANAVLELSKPKFPECFEVWGL